MASKSFVFRFGDVEVREREFSLTKADETLAVEPKAFRVLLTLLRNPGKLIPKEELLNAVWGDAAVTENSLTRSIALLRRLLGDDTRNPRYIETVATVGYRLVCKVEVSEEAPGILAAAGESAAGNETVDATEMLAAQVGDGVLYELKNKKPDGGGRKNSARRLLFGAVLLISGLAGAILYLRHPLPPPRITAYTQLTHDGHEKDLVGTDGSRLYFNGSGIQQVSTTGGEIAPIPIAAGLEDVSPDGSSLLVAKGGDGVTQPSSLWNARVLGGSLHRLGDGVDATFSPDGNSVAYSTPEGAIYVVGSNGTDARKLASVGGEAYSLAWSRDGRTIRFTRDNRLWEISSSGSNLHQLFPSWHASAQQCCGRWTEDGRFFLFLSGESVSKMDTDQPGSPGGEIWAGDERRTAFRQIPAEPIQLTTGPIHWGPPVPGKDGKRIFSEGRTLRGELSRFDSHTKQIQPFLGGISAQGVTFSRDGKSVAYVSWPEGILWRANQDGSNPVQLTDPPIEVYLPHWSPDGTQIVFTDMSSPRHHKIYIVSSDGGSPRRVLPAEHAKDVEEVNDPSWSADGRKLVYDAGLTGDPKADLRIFDVASHQVTPVPGSVGIYSPRWSPDGRFIAAMPQDGSKLMIFDVEMQRWSVLVQIDDRMDGIGFPEWSKDGRWIYFVRGYIREFRIHVEGGQEERIADLKVRLTGWWNWVGLDPTDAPLVLRDIGSNDIYALTLEEK